jgi:DNA helicase-2/ATP-dependent DNA helicase PcrA
MAEALTASQQQAVTHDAGPLIVLAGPGTGKTRTIVHRVAHMVSERHVEPESIVALTFTVKAAAQLRERLAALVGPLTADRLNVSTIHGFGHRIVRRFGDLLHLPPDLELIDAAQSHRMLTQIILTNGLFTASRAEGIPTLLRELDQAAAGLANRGLSFKQCLDFEHGWRARLERGPGPGQTKDEYQAECAQRARFADALVALDLFARERWKRGLVAFDDFLTLPLRLFREHPSALSICRTDYRAFVVDEFQDCNPAQIELLHQLAPKESTPDLCVVGDDDQAIYRFRGADEQAFRRFEAYWPNPAVVTLEENYRSQPPLIATANAVIGGAQVRFRPDKKIRFPGSKQRAAECGVECVKLEATFQDAEVIAAMITADRAATASASTPRPLNHYAVIARSHTDLDRIAAGLRLEGIPYERAKERTPLEDPGVEDVLAWVEWLTDPSATWAARRVLTRPPFAIPPDIALGWELEYGAQASHFRAGRPGAEEPGRFDEWLAARAAEYPEAVRAAALYRTLLEETASLRGDDAVFRVITATDAAHAELLPGRERAERVSALVSLLALARDKQRRLEPPANLAEFWAYFQELRAAAGGLPVLDSLESAAEKPEPGEGEGKVEERVQLMTAHASKGLEFDTVFVPRVKAPHGYPSTRAEDCWELPEGLFNDLDGRSEAERRCDEERRLFYVACTRAERRLVLLSKPNKTATSTVNYFDEVSRAGLPVSVREGAHILREMAARGAAPGSALEAEGLAFRSRSAAKEASDRARREARLAAAQALELVDRPDATPEQLGKAVERFTRAAEQLAVTAGAEQGEAPAWLLKQRPELRAIADRLAQVKGQDASANPETLLIRPLPSPLRLSYTAVYEYHKCPRCYYLNSVLRLPQPFSTEASVGTIAHAALKMFYDRWAAADADGLFKPGREQLLAIARQVFLASLGDRQEVRDELYEQLQAQMTLLYDRLHIDDAQVLETERAIDFEYTLDGVAHRFTAKLDRIDLMPDGGVRVIDYKTGYAKKAFLEPRRDDLQLGVYALALKLAKGQSWGENPRGVAEYWCLATGQRGSISLAELDEAKVREQIDKAARGMLKGEFPRKDGCGGACGLF